MSTLATQTYLTSAEYLNMERKAVTKNEYLSGQIVAMSGASNAHNIITMNTANQLYNQQIASLKEYILISQSQMHVEHHLRQESQWRATEFQKFDDVVPVPSIKCELLLGHIYRRVTFSE